MTLHPTRSAAALSLALAALALPAPAQNGGPAAAKVIALESDAMKVSQNGFLAMRAVGAARIAIINGDVQAVRDMLATAKSELTAAAKQAPVFDADARSGVKGKLADGSASLDLIPIEIQVVLADSFIETAAKKAHVDKANELFAKGHGKQALDELRLAGIDASIDHVLMPLQATERHVAEATQLVGEQKFYQATLALRAAEDGLRRVSVVVADAARPAMASKANK